MLKNFLIFLIFIQKRLQIFAYLSPENNYAGLILQESMIFYEMLLRLKSWSMTHGASLACSFYENLHSQHFGLYLFILNSDSESLRQSYKIKKLKFEKNSKKKYFLTKMWITFLNFTK